MTESADIIRIHERGTRLITCFAILSIGGKPIEIITYQAECPLCCTGVALRHLMRP